MKLIFNDINDAHEWWLDGKRASGLSSLGKKIDNTWNLEQWGLRMTMIGTAMRPDLADLALAHHDDKQALGRLVEQAKNHAKANEGANRGTAKHRISERIDLGESVLLSPAMEQFRAAYLKCLTDHALTVLPEYVERAVVYPDDRWCGLYDRIYGLAEPCPTCSGDKRIADLKSGEGAIRYPHAIAIQLTGYAYAPFTAEMRQVGNVAKFEATSFAPHPDGLCRCKGIIVHAPEDGTVGLYEIDLVPDKLDLVRTVLAWQKLPATALVRPMTSVAVEQSRQDVPATDGADSHPAPVASGEAGTPSPAPAGDPFDGLVLTETHGVAQAPRPYVAPLEPKPAPAKPDDTELIDDDTYTAFQRQFNSLSELDRIAIKNVAGQAAAAGTPVSVQQVRSVRRFEIGRALVAWAGWDATEDSLRTCVYLATKHEDVLQPGIPVGAAVGALTADEARRVADAIDALSGGTPLHFDPLTGRPELRAA